MLLSKLPTKKAIGRADFRYALKTHARSCAASPTRYMLKHLSANLGHATVRNPQTARSAERKVEDAAASPGSPVGDTNYYRLVARKVSYTNSCAERQVAVGSGQRIPIERRATRCFSCRI